MPLVVLTIGGAKVSSALAELRRWLEANLTPVTVVILLILGAAAIGKGLNVLD